MKTIVKSIFLFLIATVLLVAGSVTANGQIVGNVTVQTNPASNISNSQATLNGYLGAPYFASNYVYFQWGTTTGYGNQTSQQYLGSSGSFSNVITGLSPNTTYHFRAVGYNNNGTFYGQDQVFTTSYSGEGGYSYLVINKQVINLTSGYLGWSKLVSAKPGDILTFAISLQPAGQNIYNVLVRDYLPAGLTFRGFVTVNTGQSYSGDITNGINVGTVYANQPVVVSYQAQVAPYYNLGYGSQTLTNSSTVTSSSGTQNSSATVVVNNSLVMGATYIPTGSAGNWKTNLFIPLAGLMILLWLYFSGRIYRLSDWLKLKINK